VIEHHSNGYRLMPSPNLIASSLALRTTDTALCVMEGIVNLTRGRVARRTIRPMNTRCTQ